MKSTTLTIQYGAIQGTYWMTYATIASFASAFLLARGYSNSEIGLLIAVGNIVALVMQPIVADIADRSQKISLATMTELMTVIMMVLSIGQLVIKHRSFALFVIYVLLLALQVCLQPLFNTLNFKLQECGVELNFGLCRAGGSVAYAAVCTFIGTLVDRFGANVLPISSEIILVMMMISIIVTIRHYNKLLSENGRVETATFSKTNEQEITLLDFIKRNKMFLVLNIGVLFMYSNNQLLNTFMYQVLVEIGGSGEDLGRIFGMMAFLEIPTMVCFDRINRRFSSQKLIIFASVVFTAKMILIFMSGSVAMIYVAETLQIFSYGLFIPGMVKFIARTMAPGEQAKGQALFTMMMSFSSIVSNLVGGWLLDISGTRAMLIFGVVATIIGTIIIAATVNRVKKA